MMTTTKTTVTAPKDRVVVSVQDDEAKTTSGLYVPRTTGDKAVKYATLEAVGIGEKTEGLKAGMRVIVNVTLGLTFTTNGTELMTLPAEEVLAIIS